jgi:hypothetical protein
MRNHLDHSINHPMIVDELNIYPPHLPKVELLRQESYNLIPLKDSTVIYIITDSIDDRCYLGEKLIKNNSTERMYLLGPADTYGEYSLYLNIKLRSLNKLIEICKYNNPQQAIDALNLFNKVGSHNDTALQLYNILLRYIDREIGINDTIIGIISLFGYRDDIRLQELIGTVHTYGDINSNDLELILQLREDLPRLSKHSILFKYYHKLYDMIILYDFFKGNKYQHPKDDIIDLSDVIKIIYKIML